MLGKPLWAALGSAPDLMLLMAIVVVVVIVVVMLTFTAFDAT